MSRFVKLNSIGVLLAATALLAGCDSGTPDSADAPAADAVVVETAAMDTPDDVAEVAFGAGNPDIVVMTDEALPYYDIPHIPVSAEAYFAPDSYHLIAQTNDPDAVKSRFGTTGNLTYTYSIDGTDLLRANDKGQDACSYFFPDQQRVVFTSTRDRMDLPPGNWSDQNEYPQGAELYIADLDGNNRTRLTDNEYYEAEVSVSPNSEWIVFGRMIKGQMDLWRMRSDGSDEQQVTFTEDWQEWAPFYLPDNETIMFRAWRRSEYGQISPTPMTVFTIKHDGSNWRRYTFDRDMNWAPYPAPDGRHYVFVRIEGENNWDVYLGDLAGGEPKRLTTYEGFDGLPSLSPDGTKLAWARSTAGFMRGMRTHIMDVSSLDIGPEKYAPLDPTWGEAMQDD
jgi:TolB protein